jgi:signal transduction histidine kinase
LLPSLQLLASTRYSGHSATLFLQNASATGAPEKSSKALSMRNALTAASAWLLLTLIFVIDALTPQNLVVSILLSTPLVLTALTRNTSLVFGITFAAIACDMGAGYVDMLRAGHWDGIDVSNRILTAISISIVGYLSTEVQKRSHSIGLISAREERMRREVSLAGSLERLRLLLSRELIERGLVREAVLLFGIDGASWVSASRDRPMLSVEATSIELIDERSYDDPEIVSLLHGMLADRLPRRITNADAFGRLLLARFARASLIAFPVFEGETAHGVLMFWGNTPNIINEDEMVTARIFARSLGTVLGRADLFAELALRSAAVDERNAVIGDLVFALTHDLRTPLTALGMTMRQANEGAFGNLPFEYINILHASISAVDDLQRLAETLLTVARIENGELRNTRDPVDLQRLINEVVSECSALARSRNVAIVAHIDESATILADRGDIRRAVTNLLANALEHTPADSEVKIELNRFANNVYVRVLDEGYGIAPEFENALFQRFSTAAASSAHGTGLGLYIVRRIAEAAAGKVFYERRSPRGSIFTLSFPSAD